MPKAAAPQGLTLPVNFYRETDGRWLADIPALPGVTAYGRSKKQAFAAVEALALRVITDRLKHGEAVPVTFDTFAIVALALTRSALQ